MKISKVLAAGVAAAAVASTLSVAAAAEDYNAYIGFQSTVYSFRNSWNDSGYGQETDYFDSFIVWGNKATDPETFPDYEDNFDYDISGYVLDATYDDVTIDGDGTYTVSASDMDWALDGSSDFNLIFVSTDIPIDAGAVCTEAKIIIDGETVKTVADPICDDSQPYFNVSLANIWNPDIGSYGLAYPTESLAIEFTITGLGGDDADVATVEDENPTAAEAPAQTEAPAPAPAAGDTAAPVDSSKGSPDTGVSDVALIGGLAIVAGAAIALTRKRK